MPEYLAPAVYVEEVDTGSKPIEGVSTSTSGMVGVTERGPVDVPILVTSTGEYRRVFGEPLNPVLYGEHRFLPHSVEGFFTNGGKRLYLTRVLRRETAAAAARALVAEPAAGAAETLLLLGAAPGATTLIIPDATGFAVGNNVQADEGANAELGNIAAVAPANAVTLRLPLDRPHAGGQVVRRVTLAAGASDQLAADSTAGATVLTTQNPMVVAAGNLLAIGAGANEELVRAAGPNAGTTITLAQPLRLAHRATDPIGVQTVTLAAPQSTVANTMPATAGDGVVAVVASAGLTTVNDVLVFDTGGASEEYRRVGSLVRLDLAQPSYADLPAGTVVANLGAVPGAAAAAVAISAPATAGSTTLQVDDRSNLTVGQLIAVGLAADREILQVAALPAVLPAPNPGAIVLSSPLRRAHAAAAGLVRPLNAPAAVPTGLAVLAADVQAGQPSIYATGNAGIAVGNLVRLQAAGGAPRFHVVNAISAALTPAMVTLAAALSGSHAPGAMFAARTPILEVRALDAGQWGNRLRVAVEQQDPPSYTTLVATTVRAILPGSRLRLQSAAGVETGTELIVTDAGATAFNLKVAAIDRQNDFLVTLEAVTPLPPSVAVGDTVRSVEYRLVVELLRQPDPANPSRNNSAIDREVFPQLSLDHRHSRYFQRVVGATWVMNSVTTTQDDRGQPLRRSDRRSEGESAYVRVLDLAAGFTGLRVGPHADYEARPGASARLVLLPLSGGDDALATFEPGEATYIGRDDPNPELRSGLHSLRNVEDVSIVAAPGRIAGAMQAALINHCELMRYRFAVLDGPAPPQDTLSGVQAQRQQFDTKYAALYHPWVLIPDPYPVTTGTRADYPIPPSGHTVGIYARTDIERGVHKAPANEVMRGVIGLQRVLNKEQHDILNPYPVNINVIRDFRPNNRGIRVYGGRCITSDSDWKYVNVRRLLIFIEASVDRGLQWVVFEPNAEPLWARVKRSITNFLTQVWRNGALEGTKPEEAFFVKCDRTTMTQTDIDQGRLICLVGVAPVKPAEFVIVRIGLWTAHAED